MPRCIAIGFVGVILATSTLGCASSSSTMLYQDLADLQWKRKHSHGVPITLEVPTFVKLTIIEKKFLIKEGEFLKDNNVTIVAHDVRQEILNTKKIFTVDLKRPGAGTWESEMAFEGQYFKTIKHKGEDKTIEAIGTQVNELLKNVLPALTKTRPTSTTPSDLKTVENVVAMGVFKLDDPELEIMVTQFICGHCRLRCGPSMHGEIVDGIMLPHPQPLPAIQGTPNSKTNHKGTP